MTRHMGLVGAGVLTLAFLLWPDAFAGLLRPFAPEGGPVIYDRTSLLSLAIAHMGLVVGAVVPAAVAAVSLAALAARPGDEDFLRVARSVVNFGQTIPPVAVLALTVPLFGFGTLPTLVALFLYSLLPIFENALAGLTSVPASVRIAAKAMGLSGWQIFWQVDLPLAMPLVLDGIRLSAVIALSTTTIGSTVAAKSLGEVIIAGLNVNNQSYILQGGILTAALALLVYGGLGLLVDAARARLGALGK